jgi:glycosyltransferase involved in cell wall biosynthesis
VRLIYPVQWSTLGRHASREQSVNTVAAFSRQGLRVTLLMPQRFDDPHLGADEIRDYFDVTGDFSVVQRACPWVGDHIPATSLWLRRVFSDPETRAADVFYSRIPQMIGMGTLSPLPFATDLYRPWPDHWPWLRPFVKRTARHRKCLGLVLHSEYTADSYARAGVAPGAMMVAHNGVDERRMLPRLSKSEARRRLGLEESRQTVVYAGRMNLQKGLDEVLALADIRPRVRFVLVGSERHGPIEEAAAQRANVTVVPWQAPRDLAPYLYAADVLIVPPSRAPLEEFGNCVLPMKLFTYLFAGRPILAPVLPDTADILRHRHNAVLVRAGAREAAAAALDELLNDAALAERIAGNAQRLAAEFTWDHRAVRVSAFLQARLSGAAAPETAGPIRRSVPQAADAV